MTLKSVLRATVEQVKEEVEDVLGLEDAPAGGPPAPITRRVLSIIFNPRVPSQGGRKLADILKWNDPRQLMPKHIEDLRHCSYGYANYQVVETIDVDGFPAKVDGFKYTGDSFLKSWHERKGFHDPDAVDYHRILKEFKIIPRVNSGEIDEVWLFAFPYAGFYESIMAGPGAFWCNAPELEGTNEAKRRFVIMGYNYERGAGQMLENMGHRAESILRHVFRKKRGDTNLWERFTRYDKTHPGRAEVGIVHFAPNSLKDYDWGNKTKVPSLCDDWYNFPDFQGQQRIVDCREWGDGDTRLHHVWWFRHFPHRTGAAGGISYNWWEYVIDPNTVR